MSSQDLVECVFLIPIRGDVELSDGALHSTVEWEWLTDELWGRYGGGTFEFGIQGFYRDPDTGQKVTDESRRFIVAVKDAALDDLRGLLKQACDVFHQKVIYLSVAGRVEFIERDD